MFDYQLPRFSASISVIFSFCISFLQQDHISPYTFLYKPFEGHTKYFDQNSDKLKQNYVCVDINNE